VATKTHKLPENNGGARSPPITSLRLESLLSQARNQFERQQTLFNQGWTTAVLFDQAKKGATTCAVAGGFRRSAAKSTHDLVSFTKLKADARLPLQQWVAFVNLHRQPIP
jgi:hypothetical protein